MLQRGIYTYTHICTLQLLNAEDFKGNYSSHCGASGEVIKDGDMRCTCCNMGVDMLQRGIESLQ